MKQHDLSYWEGMAERYFQAETTEKEEAQLRKFLCSSAAHDPRFDEIKATMSFLNVYASNARNGHRLRQKSRLYVNHPLRAIAVAACLCVAVFLGWYEYQQYNISCVRIAGQDIEADASLLMQQQMTEMFNPIDQSDK